MTEQTDNPVAVPPPDIEQIAAAALTEAIGSVVDMWGLRGHIQTAERACMLIQSRAQSPLSDEAAELGRVWGALDSLAAAVQRNQEGA